MSDDRFNACLIRRHLARDRLTAAERRLDALALSEDITAEALAALLGALVEARDTLARRRRVRGAAGTLPAETILREAYGARRVSG